MADDNLSIVGKRLPRHDAIVKVNGNIKYITDIKLACMLEARFLRSPYAHARIKSMDVSAALKLPGVRAILTSKDVPKAHPWNKFEWLLDTEPHFHGEEIAAVAADNADIAEEALGLIKVDYEVLPAVYDIEEAMKPGAPLVHPEYGTNMFHGSASQPVPRAKDGWLVIPNGDVEKGFAEADAVVESSFATPNQQMLSPMPRAVICEWQGEKLNVYADTQMPMGLHLDMANCLSMPQSSIRVICAPTVGCYGGKVPEKIATLTALLAKKAGLPVRCIFTRAEDMAFTRIRPNYKCHEKIGVKKDGTITAIQSKFITNFGRDCMVGFQDPTCAALNSGTLLWGMAKNTKAEVCTVMTNIVDCLGMNAYGDTEGTYVIDRLLDEGAELINMDPVDFALKNCTRYGCKAQRYLTVMGTTDEAGAGQASSEEDVKKEVGAIDWGIMGPDADSFQECIRQVAEKSDWKKKWKGWKTPMAVNGTKRRGIGIAIGMHHTLYTKYAGTIKMNQDGTANVLSSGIEIGQGYGNAMGQVVAEVLGIRFEDVYIVNPDSAMSPAGVGNFASCGVTSGVGAIYRAAVEARRQLFNIVAPQLGVKPEELEAKKRRIQVKNRPEIGMSIAKACMDGYQITATAVNPPVEELRDEKTGKVIYPFAYAASICEVEVDIETGQLDVLRITSAHDLGKAINPQIVENQIDLSLTLGNGFCRTEYIVWDKKTGAMLNPNLLDYKIMTFVDMPKGNDIKEIFVEYPAPWGAFGAKGFSETGTTTPGPCIANAIYNAIGYRVRADHLTPENILAAMGKLRR